MATYDVFAIGELNVDLILTGLKSLPIVGREIIGETCSLVLGSSTAICASGMSALGLNVGFVGKLGKDKFGDTVLEELKKNKIDTKEVIIDETISTGITISLSMGSDRALVTYLGSIEALEMKDINLNILRETKHLHVGSFFLQHKLRPHLPELFEKAHQMGVTTSLDSGWDETNNWDYGIFETLKHTDIFFPNEGEALNISKMSSVPEAIEYLSKHVKTIVVKCGPKGAIVKNSDMILQKDPYDMKPIDTTGAGDSFNAGFIYGFLKGFDLDKCLNYGNACGSISVTRVGGASACATLDEVEKLVG